jgi:hypothetical protein
MEIQDYNVFRIRHILSFHQMEEMEEMELDLYQDSILFLQQHRMYLHQQYEHIFSIKAISSHLQQFSHTDSVGVEVLAEGVTSIEIQGSDDTVEAVVSLDDSCSVLQKVYQDREYSVRMEEMGRMGRMGQQDQTPEVVEAVVEAVVDLSSRQPMDDLQALYK